MLLLLLLFLGRTKCFIAGCWAKNNTNIWSMGSLATRERTSRNKRASATNWTRRTNAPPSGLHPRRPTPTFPAHPRQPLSHTLSQPVVLARLVIKNINHPSLRVKQKTTLQHTRNNNNNNINNGFYLTKKMIYRSGFWKIFTRFYLTWFICLSG